MTQGGNARGGGRSAFRPALPWFIATASGAILAYLLVVFYIFPVDPNAAPEVPNVVGESYEAAEQKLVKAGFTVERGEMLAPAKGSVPGKVLEQKPEAGTKQPVGTKIVLATGGSK